MGSSPLPTPSSAFRASLRCLDIDAHFLSCFADVKESESEVAQLCPTLCDPLECNMTGSSIHGIFRARIPE